MNMDFTLENDMLLFVTVSIPSGANVLGGDASSQRDDCGQVRFLRHRTGLEDLKVPRKTWPQRMSQRPGLFLALESGVTLATNRFWAGFSFRGCTILKCCSCGPSTREAGTAHLMQCDFMWIENSTARKKKFSNNICTRYWRHPIMLSAAEQRWVVLSLL